MYIPKFKQTLPRYTNGEEYKLESTGETYTGFYFETSNQEYYTGRSYARGASKKLVAQVDQTLGTETPIPQRYDDLKQDKTSLQLTVTLKLPLHIPTKNFQDIFIFRYFAKSKIDFSILEISKETYDLLFNKSTKYHYPTFDILALQWYVSSPSTDLIRDGFLQEGSITKNKKQVVNAERKLPGISQYLTDPAELI